MNQGNAPSAPRPVNPVFPKNLQTGLLDYWKFSEAHLSEINDAVFKICEDIPDLAPILKTLTPEMREKSNAESQERSRKAFVDGEWAPYFQQMRSEGEHYAMVGVSFASWVELLRGYKEYVRPLMVQEMKVTQDRLISAIAAMHEVLYMAIEVIGESYLAAKERIIRNQEEAIRELSTPVLKIRDGLLILPLIGILDSQRARRVIESMLFAIRDHRARAVVMDITGVPMVDSKVANHLVQSVEAARLMGCSVIITGLSPEIAQTMVALGAELPNVKTFGDLQGGLEEAQFILDARRGQRAMPEG